MKRTVALVAFLGLVCAPAGAQEWFKGTYADALRAAGSSDKLVLIEFSSPG